MVKWTAIVSIAAIIALYASAADAKSRAVKDADGGWELVVDGKPYYIKGVVFSPVLIGESPGDETMRDWMYYDENKNNKNDIAYDVWVDRNRNEKQDAGEAPVGDFQILKDMGCNTIRIYHVPSDNPILGDIYRKSESFRLQYDHPVNKALLREMYSKYGIRAIMGNFMGSWTVGSGTTWEQGCDYSDPAQRENIKKSVRAMVEDNKDEPYVLMWLLGNENNIATWSRCNAGANMKDYLTLVNECAKMIKRIDPDHLVGICEGFRGSHLPLYGEYLPDIDIIGMNAYMGKWGFGTMWKQVKRDFDRPVFLTEYGIFSYNKNKGDDEEMQLEYLQGCYRDMENNRAGANPPAPKKSSGNCVGGCIFDYLDRWYMDGSPYEHNPGTKYWDSPDRLDHEEYFGVTSMGDGKDNIFKRQLKKSYDFYKSKWTAGYKEK
ncbi:MAG: glycoside hydrolase family 2 TIM barrel-domain containing protein [Candidatus Omnitrophica bacterium]|jgi:beta-glucuronidase|nr:glycoside hydrolase family 2 TIM barrel-domain containing protein [Candidatus Omnitrophota bacterium]